MANSKRASKQASCKKQLSLGWKNYITLHYRHYKEDRFVKMVPD
uniref:Uncharacterized protein n=1 Tax=Anguilla anguilla TaxID=7936 RepID=A0A0E9XT89_ANGAN